MKHREHGSEPNEKIMSKQWKQVKIFETFEEADALRRQMLEKDETQKLEIRVRRCGEDGSQFKVKSFFPAPVAKLAKKGKQR